MVLHFVVASTTTSTAVTEDTAAATSFSPAGESEIQERAGGIPRLIGHMGVTGDVAAVSTATGGNYYKIENNTWPSARYIIRPWMCWANATGTADQAGGKPCEPEWMGGGLQMDRDADWTVKTMVTTANASWAVGLYLSYGARIPSTGCITTYRKVSATADSVANTWSVVGTIADLDPRATYRIGSMTGVSEDAPLLAIRLTSPTNNTYIGGLCNHIIGTSVQPVPNTIYFPIDSIIVKGVETITVEALVDAVQKPTVYVGFEEIGMTGAATTATASPGAALGGISGLLRGLGGR